MGLYINPPNQTKEEWLNEHGILVSMFPNLWETVLLEKPSTVIVCLIDNFSFTAAAVMYNEKEYQEFNTPDGRKKTWYTVPKEKIREICHDFQYYFKD